MIRHHYLLGTAVVLAAFYGTATSAIAQGDIPAPAAAPTAAPAAVPTTAPPPTRTWTDRKLSPDQRAWLLEKEMTLSEKLRLLHGPMGMARFGFPAPEGALGSAGFIPANSRLGIPALQLTDAGVGITNPRGVRPGDAATALPSGMTLASTWDIAAAERTGAILGNEAFLKGFNIVLAGGANLVRDPRNGRNFEYLSEDPLLTGEIVAGQIRGIQSAGVASTIKHYALNNQETGRFQADVLIDPAAARESDLLAFQIGIEKGKPASVMCAYNLVHGRHVCENAWLLNDVLKRDWGYPGWVMSDWGAVHSTESLLHGLDQESGEQIDAKVYFGDPLTQAAERDPRYRTRVDDAVHRILRSLFAVGAMDRPPEPGTIDYAAHAVAIRAVAAQGMVLLKNEGNLLPLKDAKRIAIVGGMAEFGVLSGGGSSYTTSIDGVGVQIPAMGTALGGTPRTQGYHPSPPLKALKNQFPHAEFIIVPAGYPSQAADAARSADVAIVFATQWMTEGQDVPDLSLPNGQDAAIAAAAAANPRTIVVLETGGPVRMPWIDKVGAVLEAWYPGGRGGEAIVDVLMGKVNPSGHLPVSFPRDESQLARPKLEGPLNPALYPTEAGSSFPLPYKEGADVGYRGYALSGEKPLFPFGFGLSYTQFTYDNLRVKGGARPSITFRVANTGDVTGAAVPQLYLTSLPGGPARRLLGWEKLTLAPGESRIVTLRPDRRLLAHFDVTANLWRLAAGEYAIGLGASAEDLPVAARVRLSGAVVKP
ncbi:beta-glucosidase [Sphingomonas sp. NFX23]|uniref:beta-glucosidase n=1 Tax=Sphingomonas sp. NFX23 TaxID=2819532 RepID=UPI003CEADE15